VVDQKQNLEESSTPKPRTTCISLVYVITRDDKGVRLLFGLERYGIKEWLGKLMDAFRKRRSDDLSTLLS
jgi:hypothetical protein